jgi:hypothetical protein
MVSEGIAHTHTQMQTCSHIPSRLSVTHTLTMCSLTLSLSSFLPPLHPTQVEQWIQQAGLEYVGDSWDELRYIRQAVQFLVVGNKQRRTLEEIAEELCPVLSIQQLYRISTMFWDDRCARADFACMRGRECTQCERDDDEHGSNSAHTHSLSRPLPPSPLDATGITPRPYPAKCCPA